MKDVDVIHLRAQRCDGCWGHCVLVSVGDRLVSTDSGNKGNDPPSPQTTPLNTIIYYVISCSPKLAAVHHRFSSHVA